MTSAALFRIQAALALVLMLAAFAGAHAWRPTSHLADGRPKLDLETLFPKQFEEWVVDDRVPVQLISPDQEAMLNKIYNQTLSRTYINKATGQRIMLSVAYGGDQSDATRAHRPEVCYPAQGFQMIQSREALLKLADHSLRTRQLVAKLGQRVEPITYWVTVGERVAVSGTEQKLAQLAYTTRGVVPDGMLVRVSSIDANVGAAYALQESFILSMAAHLPMQSRALIVGAASS